MTASAAAAACSGRPRKASLGMVSFVWLVPAPGVDPAPPRVNCLASERAIRDRPLTCRRLSVRYGGRMTTIADTGGLALDRLGARIRAERLERGFSVDALAE